jgi:hypothetical protein
LVVCYFACFACGLAGWELGQIGCVRVVAVTCPW